MGTISGTSISFGTLTVFKSDGTDYMQVEYEPNTANKCIIAYKDTGNGGLGTAIVGTVSGTSISFGSATLFNNGNTIWPSISFDPNTANKFVVAFQDDGNSDQGTAVVGTVSGTSISYGSEYIYNTSYQAYISIAFDTGTANKFVVNYRNGGNSHYGTAIVGTLSGTSISYGTSVVYNSANSSYGTVKSNSGKVVIVYKDEGNSGYPTAVVGTVSGTGISFGAEQVIDSIGSHYTAFSFDPNTAGKFVATYRPADNSTKGTAVICQFSTLTTNLPPQTS